MIIIKNVTFNHNFKIAHFLFKIAQKFNYNYLKK